ncbi:C2H2 finger domain-containing [Cordyceps militaris]|uniref:C2H2 finger domain-containing n=1 Tax=Cordyceps militaris TaxID=73501 RepID=A0A2H4SN18_CORMI|nr:C2H2 finger domain-containing [Cordyceps militaris]
MPRYIKSELEEAQSLVSDYSFPTTSTTTAALFAFSQGENGTDLLTSSAWCLPGDGSQYLTEIHDGSISHVDIEESMFTSGQTTPKGTRIAHAHQPVEATWNTARPMSTKSQAMSRMSSSTSGCSSASNGSHLIQNNPIVGASQAFHDDTVHVMGSMQSLNGCQMSETVGSPICWPGYGLDISLNGDCCTLSVEDMNSMNVAPSQVTIGLDGLPATSPCSSWDHSSSSRTSSPQNTFDEPWRVAAMDNSPMNFMGDATSPENKPLHLSDVQDTMAPFGGDMNISGNYQQRSSVESDSPREDHRYKNAVRGTDGLFHCPWEGQAGCSHKPEKLKCNYDKYVDSHLKPYKCKVASCEDARFSSTACRLRHEREAHGLHGHGNKPFLCTHEGCERAQDGNGFPRQWNLRDHMKRVHNDVGDVPAPAPAPVVNPAKGRKRKNETQEAPVVERKVPTKPTQQQSARKNSTKPLLDEWQDHYQALQGILQGMVAPGDHRNIVQLDEVQKRSVEMAKITSQLVSVSKLPRDTESKKGYNSGD